MERKLCGPAVFASDKKLVVKGYEASIRYRFTPFRLKDVRVTVSEAMNYEGPDTIRLECMGPESVPSSLVFDVYRRPKGTQGFNVTLRQDQVNTVMSAIERENQLLIRGPNFELILEAVGKWEISGLPICKKAQNFLRQQVDELGSAFEIICRGMHLIEPEKPLECIRDLSNGTWSIRFQGDYIFDIRTERAVVFDDSEIGENCSLIVAVTAPKTGRIEGKLDEVLTKLSAKIRSD